MPGIRRKRPAGNDGSFRLGVIGLLRPPAHLAGDSVAVFVHVPAALFEVLASCLGLVDGGLSRFRLLALGHDLAGLGQLVAQLVSTRVRRRRELRRRGRLAAESPRQSRSHSGPSGHQREGSTHEARCYTAALPA